MFEFPSEAYLSLDKTKAFPRKHKKPFEPRDPRTLPGWEETKPHIQAAKLRIYQTFLAQFKLQTARKVAHVRTLSKNDRSRYADPTYREALNERKRLQYHKAKATPEGSV